MATRRVRKNFRVLEVEHYSVIKNAKEGQAVTDTELSTLIRCFAAIQKLDHTKFNSFFTIAGYHGMPFRGAGWGNPQWWGGYCHHGNILFPVWHRAYLWRLETALIDIGKAQGIPGAEGLAFPFWDEAAEHPNPATPKDKIVGIPQTFGLRKLPILIDGKVEQVYNPLFSYKFQRKVSDNLNVFDGSGDPTADYTKPKDYETVRYPLSGLVGSESDIKETAEHNAKYTNDEENFEILNQNVRDWLGNFVLIPNDTTLPENHKLWTGVREKWKRCLNVPHYVPFSNTTSAAEWNQANYGTSGRKPENPTDAFVPIESPHNSIHLAIGGFDIAKVNNHRSPIAGANGDMGENDTASFDPIFFFHHAFVDRMFWLWQKKHNQTKRLLFEPEIFDKYPGTNSVDSQGPTPGIAGGSWLSLDETPLDPFCYPINVPDGRPLKGQELADIEGRLLNYTYGPGSFEDDVPSTKNASEIPVTPIRPLGLAYRYKSNEYGILQDATTVLRVTGPSRAASRGSFLISVHADIDGKGPRCVGHEAVLSRWHVSGCRNCQSHLGVKAFVAVHGLDVTTADNLKADNKLTVQVHTRDDKPGEIVGKSQMAHFQVGTVGYRWM